MKISANQLKGAGMVLLPVLCIAVALVVFSMMPKSNEIVLEGTVEIATSTCYAQVSGMVQEVPVQTGQTVKAGDVLALLDDSALENQIAQQETICMMKEAVVRQLQNAPNLQSVQAARAAAQSQVAIYQEKLVAAQRAQVQAQNNYEEQQQLFEIGAVSQKELDQYQTACQDAAAAIRIASAELDAAVHTVDTFTATKPDADAIQAAQADVQLSRLQLENLQRQKAYYQVTALQDGVVIQSAIEPGNTVVQGQSLFELSRADQRYFVFYLPQEYSRQLAFGQEVPIYRVNAKEPVGTAEICYIDWKAVYTPENFETSANKNKKSIKIKARIRSAETLGVGETLTTRLQKMDA